MCCGRIHRVRRRTHETTFQQVGLRDFEYKPRSAVRANACNVSRPPMSSYLRGAVTVLPSAQPGLCSGYLFVGLKDCCLLRFVSIYC